MKPIYSFGLVVNPTPFKEGVMWAEVVPSGYGKWFRRFLPNVGNWWFEIHTDTETWAYEEGGSGGAYTFSGCVRKASAAVDDFVDAEWKREKSERTSERLAFKKASPEH